MTYYGEQSTRIYSLLEQSLFLCIHLSIHLLMDLFHLFIYSFFHPFFQSYMLIFPSNFLSHIPLLSLDGTSIICAYLHFHWSKKFIFFLFQLIQKRGSCSPVTEVDYIWHNPSIFFIAVPLNSYSRLNLHSFVSLFTRFDSPSQRKRKRSFSFTCTT